MDESFIRTCERYYEECENLMQYNGQTWEKLDRDKLQVWYDETWYNLCDIVHGSIA